MVAASAALTLSGVPFMGPIGAARVGYINGEYVLNPPIDEMPSPSSTSSSPAPTGRRADGRIRSQGAFRRHHARRRHVRPQGFQPVIDAIIKLAEKAAKEPRDFSPPDHRRSKSEDLKAIAEADLRAAYAITQKQERRRRRRRQGQGHGRSSLPAKESRTDTR
jgi:polyribonucleotide nucleotidyltransferase